MEDDCIFCKIARRRDSSEVVFRNDKVIADRGRESAGADALARHADRTLRFAPPCTASTRSRGSIAARTDRRPRRRSGKSTVRRARLSHCRQYAARRRTNGWASAHSRARRPANDLAAWLSRSRWRFDPDASLCYASRGPSGPNFSCRSRSSAGTPKGGSSINGSSNLTGRNDRERLAPL